MNFSPRNNSSAQVEFLPTSGLDNTGRVFRYEGEIYRGIYKSHSHFYRQLFSSPLGSNLEKLGLIPTEIDSGQLANFDLILKHKTIPFVSYPIEWCSAMLQAAALVVCDIQLRLLPNGLVLKDGHPYNVVFSGTKPLFVDIGSIEKLTGRRFDFFIKEFINDFYFPLLLVYGGYREVLNAFLIGHLGLTGKMSRTNFLFLRLFLGTLPLNEWLYHLRGVRKIKICSRHDPIEAIKLLKSQIDRIPIYKKAYRSHSHQHPKDLELLKKDGSKSRTIIITEIIEKISPKSAIVFSDNEQSLSEYISLLTDHVIDANTDDDYLNNLFLRHIDSRSNKLLPVRLDILWPTPSHGPWGICSSGRDRLQSELSVICNLTPKTLNRMHRTLNDIFSYISCFCTQWSLIDFRLPTESSSSTGMADNGVTLATISDALNSVYVRVKAIPQPDERGWIFLCAKTKEPLPPM